MSWILSILYWVGLYLGAGLIASTINVFTDEPSSTLEGETNNFITGVILWPILAVVLIIAGLWQIPLNYVKLLCYIRDTKKRNEEAKKQITA